MKLQRTLLLLPALLAMSAAAQAAPHHRPPHQGPQAVGTAPPPPAHRGPKGPAVPPAVDYGQQTVQGVAQRYLQNPHGEVDGLLLADGTQVKFPPHLGEDLAAVVQPGSTVSLTGFSDYPGSFRAFAITGTGGQVVDRPPAFGERPPAPPHLRHATLSALSAQGTVQQVLSGRHGEVKAVVLDEGTLVRIGRPRHAAPFAAAALQPGQFITVTGYGTENAYGRVVDAATLSAAGQSLPLTR